MADAREERVRPISLDRARPSEIRSFLDESVIGQDRAKRSLAVAVYNHFKRLRSSESADDSQKPVIAKSNMLIIGPTGSGKTHMVQTLAKRLGLPFTMSDATSLTEAGYVGEDVESIIKNLWLASGKSSNLTERGIVCLDEVDKLARRGNAQMRAGRDVGAEGVQQALLKIIESQRISINPGGARGRPPAELVQIETDNILFICAGAFAGLDEIIERRLRRSAIGFGAEPTGTPLQRSDLLRHVSTEDLVAYGLIPEFIGRLPVVVTLDELSEGELVEVLWRPKNALIRQYRRLMELDGVRLRFHQEAMQAIVKKAKKRSSGARGLRSVLEETMLDVMYSLPSRDNVLECVITAECVEGTGEPILTTRSVSIPLQAMASN